MLKRWEAKGNGLLQEQSSQTHASTPPHAYVLRLETQFAR